MNYKYKVFFTLLVMFTIIIPESLGQTAIGDLHYVTDDFKTPFSFYPGDFDGDGDNDIVAGSSTDSIVWFRNDGEGEFSNTIVITTELDNLRSVFACDIDNDGDIDILSASVYDSTVAWIENYGNANFGSPNIIATDADYLRWVGGYDMDNDNDIDVVACYMNSIVWYINDGDCNFSEAQIISTAYSRNLCVADINGDNLNDVFTTNLSDDGLLWLKNNGDGNFVSNYVSVYSRTSECYDIDVTDINSNGKMDLIVSSKVDSYYGHIGWYERNAINSIVFVKRVGLGYEVFEKVVAGDLSSDTLSDIFATHNFDHALYWFQRSDPFFLSHEIPYHLMEVGELLLSDMDLDGDEDVVMSSVFSHDIVWFENLTLEFLLQPQSQIVCTHESVTFSTKIKDAISYIWQVKGTDDNFFNNIDEDDNNYKGVVTNELQIVDAMSTMNNFQYRCKASNGKGEIYSDTVNLMLENDTEPPILVTKNSDLYLRSSELTELSSDLIIESLTDNCNYTAVVLSEDIFSCSNLGENSIDVTAIDGSGNRTTKTTVVIVIDTIPPVIQIGNDEIEIFTPSSSFIFDFEYIPLSLYYDNCMIESITNSLSNSESIIGMELSIGSNDIEWSVSDNSGNISKCSQKIIVTNSNEYNIYPNPVDYFFKIEQKYLGEYQMKIFDIAGKLVFESDKVFDKVYHFDCQILKRGSYIVQINNGLQSKDYKIVVSK